MNRPQRYLTRIFLFLTAVIIVCGALFSPIEAAFIANPALNGLIAATLIIGVFIVIRQIMQLSSARQWLDCLKEDIRHNIADDQPMDAPPTLLSPLSALTTESDNGPSLSKTSLSTLSMRTILDGVGARLDESRELSRYLIGLLIFLGLLGTFWGLLGTIGSIKDTIDSLNVGGADITLMFEDLKEGLAAPLGGMGTAFSSSLFGLAGSVILGFVDLQAGQAQNRFYNDLEDWLSSVTKFSAASMAVEGGTGSTPAFVGALLEQSADSMDRLQRSFSHAEDGRAEITSALVTLATHFEAVADQQKNQNALLEKILKSQLDSRNLLRDQIDSQQNATNSSDRNDASLTHLRNMDVQLKQLNAEITKSRQQLGEELRSELRLLSRSLGTALDQMAEKKSQRQTTNIKSDPTSELVARREDKS
ncbi:MAG: flagellar motor protein MotA [Kordiimonas sp.]|nr:flagellar motor protein MotA [Kordiimonas sp.]|tara:strand:+ start:1070 stop:2329 length:1260 start_codon:yes stop_codon:yes gene_type:complete